MNADERNYQEDPLARQELIAQALASSLLEQSLDSVSMTYGVTVIAMVLVVVALGSLLNLRPIRNARWTDIDRSGDRVARVTWNDG